MKPLTFVICVTIIAVITVGTCGCTSLSNVTKSGVAPSVSPPPDNLASAIDSVYKNASYTVITPFTMTKNGDIVTYHGVVSSPPAAGTPYKLDITIVLTANATAAHAAHDAGQVHVRTQKEYYPTYQSGNQLAPPGQSSLLLSGTDTGEHLNTTAVADYYQVVTFFATPVNG